jgi:pyridoxal 5'-phosphate synthase pdxS subunit
MAAVEKIVEIQKVVTIPVMAKARIGHFVEAQLLQELGVDFIDESEVLTPADAHHHVDKLPFRIPFVCGATCLAEALRRIGEGAAMLRTKGEAGTGNIIEAVRHLRLITQEIRELTVAPCETWMSRAKELGAPYHLVAEVAENGCLPVPNFAAGGVATPADAALVMQLGAEAVFVGSGIFKSEDPQRTAAAVVKATAQYQDPSQVLAASRGLGAAMRGMEMETIPEAERLQTRGW